MPSTHHILATIYNKILLRSCAPEIWTRGKTILIHKGGNPEEPENFRMITLTSCLIKPLHLILARKLESYMITNGYLDEKVQKGFLSKISGCIDHTYTLQELIQDAKFRKKTLNLTSYDIKDAGAFLTR